MHFNHDCLSGSDDGARSEAIQRVEVPMIHSHLHQPTPSSNSCTISSQKSDTALVTPLGLQLPMDGGDHTFSGGFNAHFPLENTI
ncbi:hypothetical protein EVAR_44480_1 [Eumeta japonica]|uniref:Uncharacterized protein n=1 Tax=Eumeta variegata TaxID=151549 RepID=A0A4C1WN07_EUMVA|nr:hypothetical protein EVAR_44480_1 [Eumeta japonica]